MIEKKLPDIVYSIDEFKKVFEDFGIEEDKTKFYLGKYHLSPKAYGIYQIDDDYIVYKIKNNGDTTIRYKGPNEQIACKELYTKFLQEVSKRKGLSKKYNPYHDDNYAPVNDRNEIEKALAKRQSRNILIFIFVAFLLIDGAILLYKKNHPEVPQTTYYQHDNNYYKNYNNNWYYWDDTLNDWYIFYPSYSEYNEYDDITDSDDNYYYDYGEGYDDYDYYDYDFDFSDSYSDWGSDW